MAARRKRSPTKPARGAKRSSSRKRATARGGSGKKRPGRYWSGRVTRESNALDLDAKVFNQASARKIAASLKRSAKRSRRRKAKPFQSAMSMLNFYINRAGKNLPARRKNVLNRAKEELRHAFGRA
jgi:hypothetical protein